MPGLLDALLSGPAGKAGETDLQRILRQANATPGIVPENDSVGLGPLPPLTGSGSGNFGGAPNPTAKVPQRQIDQVASGEGFGLVDKLLGRLGKPGRALMPISNFIGGIADDLTESATGAARRGTLGAIAPEFQAGVQGADRNDLQRQLIEAQLGRIGVQNQKDQAALQAGPAGKPQTDLGKLVADNRAGFITDDQFAEAIANTRFKNRSEKLEATSNLRTEFNNNTKDIRTSKSDLSKAKALVQEGNPIAATAAFTAFIRSIDNSVVRPAEQAAYSEAGGLARRLQDELSKLQGQGPLSGETRKDLIRSIEIIEGQLNDVLDRTTDFYSGIGERAQLDPAEITGIPSSRTQAARDEQAEEPSIDFEVPEQKKGEPEIIL